MDLLLLSALLLFSTQDVQPGAAPDSRSAASAPLPPRAYSVGAAFDARRERLVLFGGKRPGPGYVGATWEHGKDGWREVATDGPSARNSPAMAYDEGRGVTVLFGGDDARGARGDTWEWNGRAWRSVAAAGAGPAARTNARLAYDPKRGAVVLQGGFAGSRVFGDAWQWDGTTWSLVAAEGPERFVHGFAVTDAGWLVFGGIEQPPSGTPPPPSGETWIARDGAWTRWEGQGPGARDHITLAHDPVRRRTLFHGGFLEGQPSSETWEFDGARWSRMAVKTGPGVRAYPALVFDTSTKRLLLYGGFDSSGPRNDLWAWNGDDWTRVE